MNRTHYERLGEDLYSAVLPNGLKVYVVPRPGFSRKRAYFVTDFGSVHQDFELEGEKYHVPGGIAHYLEHKMFDLPGRDVSAELAALGASVNAFTSYDMTAYYFSCTEYFEKCLKLLLEFVSTPYFTEETVEKERGIIDQEIGMNQDAPDSRIFELLTEGMYQNHPIRVPILGTSESIRAITPELLHLCHRAFYVPSNMVLCVVGDVDPASVVAVAREVLPEAYCQPGKKLPFGPEAMTCSVPLQKAAMEVAMPTFQLGFKCAPTGTGEAAIRAEVIGDLAAETLFGEASELYLRLYERGNIDSSFGGGFETIDGCAMLTCGGDSEQPEAVRDAIVEQAKLLAAKPLDAASFRRMKRSAMGRRVRDLDSFDSTCFRICAYRLADFDYFEFPRIYESIREEEVRAFLAEAVTEDRCALTVIHPL